MKRFKSNLLVLTAVLFLAGTAAAFAGGQNEAPSQNAPNASSGQATQVTVAKSLTTVTGQVQIVNRIHPVITSGSTSYELIVPRFDVYQSGVKDGQTITIKGYKIEGGFWGPYGANAQNADPTPRLLVSSATVAGKTYDLQQWANQFKTALANRGTYGRQYGFRGPGPMMGYGQRDGRGPRGGFGRGNAPGYGMGYGPSFGPGFGPGMGYRFQNDESGSNQ